MLQTALEEEGTYSGYTYFYGVATQTACAVYGGTYTVNPEGFYPKTTFTYEGGSEEPGIAPLSEVNALEDGSEFKFGGDAVVTLKKGDYMWLRDESGYGLIYGALDGTFENGQVLNQGWTATKTIINDGWIKYTDAANLSASGETNADLAAAQVVTALEESMINAYVCFENMKINGPNRPITTPDNDNIPVYDLFNMDWPGGGGFFPVAVPNKNVYGIVCKVDGALKLIPVEFVTYVEPEVLRGDVNSDNDVTIADVAMLIDYLLMGDAEAVGANLEAADCNLDEDVSIADVAALIDYLLIGHW